MFKRLAIVAAVAAACSGSAFAAPTYIMSGLVEATIADGGYFQPGSVFPAVGGIGMRYNGVEYVNVDNQSSWFWFSPAAGPANEANGTDTMTNPLVTTTYAAGAAAATSVGVGAWSFGQLVVATPNSLQVTLTIRNLSSTTALGATYSVGFDPDQDGSGKNATINTITGLAGDAAVTATGPLSGYRVTLRNDTSALASAVVGYTGTTGFSCCSPVDAGTMFAAGQGLGFTNNVLGADDVIGLGYKLGDIAPGESVSIGYSYVFAVPEPGTYALLLAGLGAIGFIAKRRKLL